MGTETEKCYTFSWAEADAVNATPLTCWLKGSVESNPGPDELSEKPGVFSGACPEATTSTTTPEAGSGSGSLPWWGWALIAVPILAILAGGAYLLMKPKEAKPQKKKRAVKAPEPPAAPEPAPTPTQTVYTAPPVQSAVSFVAAPPVYVEAAAPVATTATPVVTT